MGHTEATKAKISAKSIEQWKDPEARAKITANMRKPHPSAKGKVSPNYGKPHTEATKERMRKPHPSMRGYNNPNWLNGKSYEPYTPEFNPALRRQIKQRDGNKCVLCGGTYRLAGHHIDYNKENNNPNNLVTLCASCNTKVNFNRPFWQEYLTILFLLRDLQALVSSNFIESTTTMLLKQQG